MSGKEDYKGEHLFPIVCVFVIIDNFYSVLDSERMEL